MTKSKTNKTKNEDLAMFDEVKIGNLCVKPWSFGTLFDVSPIMEEILTTLEKKDVQLDELIDEVGNISFISIAKLFAIASNSLLKLIVLSVTCEKDDVETEVRNLDMKDGVKLALTVWSQNKDRIVKSFNVVNLESSTSTGDSNEEVTQEGK